MSAPPAGTPPCPGSGVITIEPTAPISRGSIQSGAVEGSIHREGTGGNPRIASLRPGTSSGFALTEDWTGPLPPRTQITKQSVPVIRCDDQRGVRETLGGQRRRHIHAPSQIEGGEQSAGRFARNAVRSRSMRRASRTSW